MKKQLVSFVIPCYRSAETIGSVVDEIEAAMGELERYEYEIILVNDCSASCAARINGSRG